MRHERRDLRTSIAVSGAMAGKNTSSDGPMRHDVCIERQDAARRHVFNAAPSESLRHRHCRARRRFEYPDGRDRANPEGARQRQEMPCEPRVFCRPLPERAPAPGRHVQSWQSGPPICRNRARCLLHGRHRHAPRWYGPVEELCRNDQKQRQLVDAADLGRLFHNRHRCVRVIPSVVMVARCFGV